MQRALSGRFPSTKILPNWDHLQCISAWPRGSILAGRSSHHIRFSHPNANQEVLCTDWKITAGCYICPFQVQWLYLRKTWDWPPTIGHNSVKASKPCPRQFTATMLCLQKYTFQLVYKKGKHTHLADKLSQASWETTDEHSNEEASFEEMSIQRISSSCRNKFRDHTARDKGLQALCKIIQNGWPKCLVNLPASICQYLGWHRHEGTQSGNSKVMTTWVHLNSTQRSPWCRSHKAQGEKHCVLALYVQRRRQRNLIVLRLQQYKVTLTEGSTWTPSCPRSAMVHCGYWHFLLQWPALLDAGRFILRVVWDRPVTWHGLNKCYKKTKATQSTAARIFYFQTTGPIAPDSSLKTMPLNGILFISPATQNHHKPMDWLKRLSAVLRGFSKKPNVIKQTSFLIYLISGISYAMRHLAHQGWCPDNHVQLF